MAEETGCGHAQCGAGNWRSCQSQGIKLTDWGTSWNFARERGDGQRTPLGPVQQESRALHCCAAWQGPSQCVPAEQSQPAQAAQAAQAA